MTDPVSIRTLSNDTEETLKRCDVCQRGTMWQRTPSDSWVCTRCNTRDEDLFKALIAQSPEAPPVYARNSAFPVKEPRKNREIAWPILVGACLAALSSFLPYASDGFNSVSGIASGAPNGRAGLQVGMIIAIWELIYISRRRVPGRKTAAVQGLFAGGLPFVAMNSYQAVDGQGLSGGGGLYLLSVAGIVLLIGAVWRFICA
jgi:hypothetical protein